jgi:hypothetical protein
VAESDWTESCEQDGNWIAQLPFMRTAIAHAIAIPVAAMPSATDTHYETENRMVWNDEKRLNEEHSFVYEVSWVPELGEWRWFLRAHRKP